MDRIEEWRVFVSVARMASFSKAAQQHRVSPQAVTRAVAALEERLGTRLLHRTTRSVALTSEGEHYLEQGQRALAEFERLEMPVDARAPLRGVLSIAAPVLFGQLHVVPLVTTFLEAHPHLDVRLALLDRVVSLSDEGVDVAVRIGSLSDSALRARRLAQVHTVVCASPQYLKREGTPRTPSQLAHHPCIAFTGTTPVANRWSFPDASGRERPITVRARLTVNTGQAAIDAALEGLGVVRVLSYQVQAHLAAGRLVRLLVASEPPPVPVNLVQLTGAPLLSAGAFAEFVAEALPKRLGERVIRSSV